MTPGRHYKSMSTETAAGFSFACNNIQPFIHIHHRLTDAHRESNMLLFRSLINVPNFLAVIKAYLSVLYCLVRYEV